MPNPHRATIAASLNGADHDLCLNLTALAEIEAELKCNSLDLLNRPLAVHEAIAVVHAGLRGAGKTVGRKAVMDMLDPMKPGDIMAVGFKALLAAFVDPQQESTGNPPSAASPSAASPGRS